MTQGEILFFAYCYAKSKLNSEFAAQREYGAKRFKELSELLERLGMKSAQTEPLPCKIGDTLYITPCLVGEKSEEIKKVTVTNMQYYDVSHETQAEVSYGNGVIGVVNETDFYQTHIVQMRREEQKMAQVLLSMEEYKQTEQKMSAIKGLQKFVKGSNVFEDNTACWNTEQDVIRPFSLEETKALVKLIFEL